MQSYSATFFRSTFRIRRSISGWRERRAPSASRRRWHPASAGAIAPGGRYPGALVREPPARRLVL